jgi:hypothetical protein
MDPPLRTVPATPPADPLDRVGLIDSARSLMPAAMWRGTPMARARMLILELPAAPQSRALRDLQFRLLTTRSTPPSPDGAEVASLFILRVEKLAAMAEAESAHELLRHADGREGSVTSRLVTEALMRVDQRDSACARVKAAGDRFKDLWWREAAIVCHIHAREADAARTRLDGLRSASDASAAFIALAMRALGDGPAPPLGPTDDGLTLALLDIAGLPTPTGSLDSPALLRAAIENKAIALERRVEIAERAERSGTIEPDRLAEFYGELSRGLKDAAATTPTAWRAVVFAQAQGAASNEQRVILAHRLYQVSRDTADSAIRALSAPIAAARPTQAHAEFATSGFLAALILNRFDRASEWFAAAGGGPGADDRLALLAPLAAIARLPDRPPLDAKAMERRAALRPQTAAALHAVLSALESASRETLAPLAPTGARPAPDGATSALLGAAEAGRFAETICRIAALAGTTPLERLEPAKVAAILRALLLLNRRDEARAFALEYAIVAGL